MAGRIIVQNAGKMQRKLRKPAHTFNLKMPPYLIQPFLIAPVLPGETMKNFLMQARVVSDPIKNPEIGWWCEYYIFYVKHRDLYERDYLVEMVLDPAWSVTDVTTAQGGTAADVGQYYAGGTGMINWTRLCLRRVIDEYFRDEGQTYANNTIAFGGDIGTQAIAQIMGNSWLDSVVQDGEYIAQDVEVEGPDANSTIQASEVADAMRKWEMLRMNNLTNMSYEDFLASYGVRPEAIELHRPELVRYVRDWTYPTNTIDPTNGTPRSAVSWSIQERADLNRFFNEPGFLFGVTVIRPKVYLRNQKGSAVETMNDLYTWLPAMLAEDARASFKKVADAVGPLGAISDDTAGWWLDVRDIFMHGDQFCNFATTATDKNMVPLPTAGLTPAGKRFVSALADIQELFVTGASAYFCRQDGVCNLTVASSVRDMSPRGGPGNEA